MHDVADYPAASLPDIEPLTLGPADPPRGEDDPTTAERLCKVVKNCGDCDLGGFGSTFGFSPR